MPSLSDLKRAWLLRNLGLTAAAALSEADLQTLLYNDQSFNAGVRRVKIPQPPALQYYFPFAAHSNGVSSSLGNGNLRLYPWLVEDRIGIDRIGAEITTIGEVGSKLRLGVYASDASGLKPGNLLLDAGQVNGDSATVQELVCDLTIDPGIYFLAAAVQAAPVTQPTVRVHSLQDSGIPASLGVVMPTPGLVHSGFLLAGIAGALPGSAAAAGIGASTFARLFVRAK